jgi:uncharacterized RDD family membrane protein YckC
LENNQINIDNLELASTKSRIRAFVIDDLAITFIVMLILWEQISASGGDLLAIVTLINAAFIQVIFLKVIYQTLFIWYYGATLGKMIAKIKVIDFDHFGRVNLVNALLRSMGRILSEMVFYIGFLVAFYTDSKQTFHDKMGKTLVVNS